MDTPKCARHIWPRRTALVLFSARAFSAVAVSDDLAWLFRPGRFRSPQQVAHLPRDGYALLGRYAGPYYAGRDQSVGRWRQAVFGFAGGTVGSVKRHGRNQRHAERRLRREGTTPVVEGEAGVDLFDRHAFVHDCRGPGHRLVWWTSW